MDDTCANVILGKKIDSYSTNNDDFAIPQELTVTITLSEYRKLITSHATKEAAIKRANDEKWKYQAENEKLKEEVAELEVKLYESTLEQEKEVVE